MDRRVVAANATLLLVFAVFMVFYFEPVRERLLPPMYDDPGSFARVDAKPGWTDTGIVVEEGRPVGIIVSGTVSTPRLAHDTASERDKPYEIGPEGAMVPEELIRDWRELDDFPAFALVGRVNGGRPFLIGRTCQISTPGRLELKINTPLWDKTLRPAGTTQPVRKGPLTDEELGHLRSIRGFFAYRTWDLRENPPQAPHLPMTAVEISGRYGSHDESRGWTRPLGVQLLSRAHS